jgi:quercetin dioxygenase-like cupin family protein
MVLEAFQGPEGRHTRSRSTVLSGDAAHRAIREPGEVATTTDDSLLDLAHITRSLVVPRLIFILLSMFALSAALVGGSALARQGEAEDSVPGVAVETLGRSPLGEESGAELVLLRVTIEPGASLPASDEPRAAVVVLEEGRVGVALEPATGQASLTLAGGNGSVPLTAGAETILAPGDAVTAGEGARLALHNAGDGEAMLLYTAVVGSGDSLFAASAQDASGTFSVETFACPEGMTLATLEMDACEPSAESLVQWSLASDQFEAPLGADEGTVTNATTTWQGLPSGTYFVDLTAESFAPGYGDYYIPSSNQITRQDERTTRIYFDAIRSRESSNTYVFAADPAAS